MLGIPSSGLDHAVRHVDAEGRLAGSHHRQHRVLGRRAGRVVDQPGDERLLGRVGVDGGQPAQPDRLVFFNQVDGAPIGQRRHHQPGDPRERRLEVERRRERRARLGQDGQVTPGRLLGLVEASVVERQRRPGRQLPPQRQVIGAVAPAQLGLHHRQHPQHLPPRGQRQHQVRTRPQRPQHPQIVAITGHALKVVVIDRRDKLRFAGAQHSADPAEAIGGKAVPVELIQQGHATWIAMDRGDRPERGRLAQRRSAPPDDRPVGQARHDQVRDGRQRRLDVERCGQRRAGFGQDGQPLMGSLGLGARLPLGRVELGIVDRQGGPPGQFLGQGQIGGR